MKMNVKYPESCGIMVKCGYHDNKVISLHTTTIRLIISCYKQIFDLIVKHMFNSLPHYSSLQLEKIQISLETVAMVTLKMDKTLKLHQIHIYKSLLFTFNFDLV